MTHFSWLHITDLHQGMTEQKRKLPDVRNALLNDLENGLFDKCGPWDLVLFTGDLTFKGGQEEFQDLEKFLFELWEIFAKKGFNPKLLAVPGNHDLHRPSERDASVKVLKNWHKDKDVRDEFWSDPNSSYRTVVKNAFSNYSNWWENQPYKPPSGIEEGILPGDFSYTFEKGGAKLGILGLNSSFLQLDRSNYEKELELDILQFNHACPKNEGTEVREDRVDWIKKHNVCLLLTHHPLSWLKSTSETEIYQRIMGAGFNVHLHGHMHEPEVMSVARDGSELKVYCQGRSVFGLETCIEYKDDGNGRMVESEVDRPSYGYVAGRVSLKNTKGILTFWPREVRELRTKIKIAPDHQCFDLVNDEHTNPVEFKLITTFISQEPEQVSPERLSDDELLQRCRRLAEHFPEKYQQVQAWKQLHKVLQLHIARLSNRQTEIAEMQRDGQYSQIYNQMSWWTDQTAELSTIIDFIKQGIINTQLREVCRSKGITNLEDNCRLLEIIRPSLLSRYRSTYRDIEGIISDVNELITSEGGVRDEIGEDEIMQLVSTLNSLASETNHFLVAIDSELQKSNEELNRIIQELKFDRNN
jgi:hypothetical protein